MFDLDKQETYQLLDPSDMRAHMRALPKQCREAWTRALAFELPDYYGSVDKAVVLGMGGSAIGGDFIRGIAMLENALPVSLHRCYGAPGFLDEKTLLIASSYSGNTEETLSAFAGCLESPAKKLVVTGGGKLAEMAGEARVPLFTIDYDSPPRAAFAHSFVPLLGLFHRLGLLKDKCDDMDEAVSVMENTLATIDETVPLHSNPAKQLAARLKDKVSIIYGAGPMIEVAQRWKGQINENSKSWAFYEVLPEVNHNAVVGYQFPSQLKEQIHVVFLQSCLIHPRISQRYRLTSELLQQAGVGFDCIQAAGSSCLAQMLGLVLYGDYVSLYLAMLYGADPTPVLSIDFLKARLAD